MKGRLNSWMVCGLLSCLCFSAYAKGPFAERSQKNEFSRSIYRVLNQRHVGRQIDLIASLQSDYRAYIVDNKQDYIPYEESNILDALEKFNFFEKSQGFNGSAGRKANVPASENARILASLVMLNDTIALVKKDPKINAKQLNNLSDASARINNVIYGHGSNQGLAAFFRKDAWDAEKGLFNERSLRKSSPRRNSYVDIAANIEILTILGPSFVDRQFGVGTAWEMWQKIKNAEKSEPSAKRDFHRMHKQALAHKDRFAGRANSQGAIRNLLQALIGDYQVLKGTMPKGKEPVNEYVTLLQDELNAVFKEGSQKDHWEKLLELNYNPYVLGGGYRSIQIDGSTPE